MHKLFSPLSAGCLLTVAALAGCGSNSPERQVATPTTAATTSAQPTLTVEVPPGRMEITKHLGKNVVFHEGDDGPQLSYYRMNDGMRMATAGEKTARPALSLIKLYLAAYVFEHGSVVDQYTAVEMISASSDFLANQLFDNYPEAINTIAQRYGLESTRSGDRWGLSVTSTYDVVKFVSQLLAEDPTNPLLVAMSQSDPISADGYHQDFGTATLSNVLGTKWGWSDDKGLNSSVSFGANFVVAATINGSAEDLTGFVRSAVTVDNLTRASEEFLEAKKKRRELPVYRLEVPPPPPPEAPPAPPEAPPAVS